MVYKNQNYLSWIRLYVNQKETVQLKNNLLINNYYLMKKKFLNLGLFTFIAMFVFATCNTPEQNENVTETEVEDETEEAIAEIREGFNNLNQELQEAFNVEDDNEFRERAEEIMEDYEERLDEYEDEMENEWDQETKQMYQNLKETRQNLEQKLDEAGDATEQEWNEFKANMREFGNDVDRLVTNNR